MQRERNESFFIFDVPGFGGRLTGEPSFLQRMKFSKKTISSELRFSIPIPWNEELFHKIGLSRYSEQIKVVPRNGNSCSGRCAGYKNSREFEEKIDEKLKVLANVSVKSREAANQSELFKDGFGDNKENSQFSRSTYDRDVPKRLYEVLRTILT